MTCKTVIILCFALFAAASLYTDEQIADLDGRIATCLQRLPAGPSDACRVSAGITPIKEQGARREYRVEPIVECLVDAGIPQGPALKSAKYCLTLSLWRPI